MRGRAFRLRPLLAAVAGGAVLCGCGGDGSSSPSAIHTDPPGGIVCVALVMSGPPLVSPAPGSTGVPVTLNVLTFDRLPIPQTISATATLSGSDGSTITSGPLTPSDGSRRRR